MLEFNISHTDLDGAAKKLPKYHTYGKVQQEHGLLSRNNARSGTCQHVGQYLLQLAADSHLTKTCSLVRSVAGPSGMSPVNNGFRCTKTYCSMQLA